MAKFESVDPESVVIGKGSGTAKAVAAYVEGMGGMQAGLVDLAPDEDIKRELRHLRAAAKISGMKIRVAVDEQERTLTWKVVGA